MPKDAHEIRIAHDGTVSTDQGAIGQLMLVEFDNDQELEADGNGLYKLGANAKSTPGPAKNTQVEQGELETSNVEPVVEMTRMMNVLRAYQMTQTMLQTESDRETNMIQTLTKTT